MPPDVRRGKPRLTSWGIAVTTAASKLVRLEFKRKAAGLTPGGIDLHQRSFDKVTGDFTP